MKRAIVLILMLLTMSLSTADMFAQADVKPRPVAIKCGRLIDDR